MMQKTKETAELAVYESAGVKRKRRISVYDVCIRGVGFFIARAMPAMTLAPFGVAFLGLERRFSLKAIISTAMVCLGYVSLFDFEVSVRYISASLIYLLFLFAAGREERDVPLSASISAVAVACALGRVCSIIFAEFTPGDIIMTFCDGAFGALGVFVFEKNRGIFAGRKSSFFTMNKIEKLCFGIMAGVVLLGLKNPAIKNYIYVANIVGLWLIILFSLCRGSGFCAICGMIIGGILGFDKDIFMYVAVFSACGAVSGALSQYGKYISFGASGVILIGSAIYSGYGTDMLGYFDIPLALCLVVFTSEAFIRTVKRIVASDKHGISDAETRNYMRTRLTAASCSFKSLSETFRELSSENEGEDAENISLLLDSVADRACRECSRISECWVGSFKNTYNSLVSMLEFMEEKGEISKSEVENRFKVPCIKTGKITGELNRFFEIYKINCVWKNKLQENRELAGEQLFCVSQILDSMADELYEERCDKRAEEEIELSLSLKSIDVVCVRVAVNARGRYVVYVEAVNIYDRKETDNLRRAAEGAIKSILGCKMVMAGVVQKSDGCVLMRFSYPEGYYVETGVATVGAGEENGDNFEMRYLSNGKFAAALSDGMGTGSRAARDSGATVSLLGEFLEAGFDKSVAVRLVNSIMVMKSANEAFSTVDMCVIDLFGGDAEFIKNGAEPSYIKRKGEVEVIRAASLPVGVMSGVTVESFYHKLEEGDILVMASDGLQMKQGHENWIKTTVKEADKNMPAKELADRIMDMAMALHGEVFDDMTVMVMKLKER